MNRDVEILAPAGGMDSLVAACRLGCGAVYLGAGDFNARRNAENFTLENLKAAIEYCHVRGVKVYITLNTLVRDSEFPNALDLIKCGCAYGADAFIIADLGLVKAVRELAPDMPMHASTQMAVSTPAGFRELEALGFSRVVIPRELSLKEIKEIKANTSVELEMFVHGAHCMSVSGQCYLSAMLGGRSGNRGLCAQPCRLPFSAKGNGSFDLSLKDLSLVDHLKELRDVGIASFKIEGRMKRPEYVAAAVAACKEALGDCNGDLLYSDLKAVFSRSGFTSGYFDGELGSHMFGTRQKEDVERAAPVLKKLQKMYEKEKPIIPISITLKAELSKPLFASASTGRIRVFTTTDYKVQKAKNHATEVSTIRTQLKKTGGTPFDVKMTDIDIDENINIPISEINNIRRSILAKLEHKLCENAEKECGDLTSLNPSRIKTCDKAERRLSLGLDYKDEGPLNIVRLEDIDELPKDATDCLRIDAFIVPVNSPQDKINRLKKLSVPFGVEIPRALYENRSKIEKKLQDLKKQGAKFAYIGTIDAIPLAKKAGLKILGGFTMNAFNSHTIGELQGLGLDAITASAELQISDIKKLKSNIPIGICAYGMLPLMLTRNCPVKNSGGCKACNQNSYLTDRKGYKFPVVCANRNGASEVLNSMPIYLADKQSDFDTLDFIILYFTKENSKRISHILKDYSDRSEPKGEFTRGLYYRGVE